MDDGGFAWKWGGEGKALDRMLWPVVRSAAELLISGDRERVRECAAEGCGWLFLDASRNTRRKWCAMTSCGNRAKARRYYERKRKRSRS
ncbi:MAG: CGNR zinc finger domain-containing protein [Firmicutes bacterium]|nr:CGNR zinc finger domain-containing protein [Bacillota bacterium]